MAARVVDAHHHFWDPARFAYPWMQAPELTPIRRPFGPADLKPLLEANGVDASIVVQCCSSVDETEALLAQAAQTPFVAGVVGWIDLTQGNASATLDRLRSRPDGPLLIGIRHQVHDEEDPRWLARDDVKRGLAAVFEEGLTYDLLVRSRELPAAIEVVRAFPHGRFVLDHAAKPPIAQGFDRDWASRITQLAACPNVWCKVSGLVTEATWQDWTVEQLRPVIRHVLDAFGEDRLLYGSDWPVCLLAADYSSVKAAAETCLDDLSASAREKIFGTNAVAAYQLSLEKIDVDRT
jgi:L-fuconolactonase